MVAENDSFQEAVWKPWNKIIKKKVNLSLYFKILTLFSQFLDYILQF